MKKNLALLIGFMCLSTLGFAQLRFGLQATPSVNWIKSESTVIDGKSSLKFDYGLLIEYALADNYLISSGVFHGYDGAKFDFIEDDTAYTMVVNPQFVNIPLTLKMQTKEIGYLTYFARFGLMGGIRVKDSYMLEDPADGETADEFLDDPTDPVTNLFKLSLNIAIGAEYNLGGSTNFLVGISFLNNFTDMLRDQSDFGNVNKTTTYNHVGLNVGIVF